MRLSNSSVSVEVADPEDPELGDVNLGASYDARMMAKIFASRWWAALPEPPTLYRFFDVDGTTIGYAVIEETDFSHPTRRSEGDAPYLYIWNVCAVAAYQKQPDGSSGSTFAMSVMRAIDELILPETEAIGTALTVREGNKPARDLYEREGVDFEYDADDRYWEDKDWWLVMRKPRS